jgi:hypothetical protein
MNSGDRKINWKQETPTKLARVKLEQKKIAAFALQAHLAKYST